MKALFLMSLALYSYACTDAAGNTPKDKIKVSVIPSANPLLVGKSTNPALQMVVFVPSDISQANVNSIHCTLNKEAVSDIQKIELYLPGKASGFSNANFLTSLGPASHEFDIPLNLKLASGVHHLWVSITLKKEADSNHFIELHVTKIVSAEGKEFPVTEGTTSFRKRIGIALRNAGDEGVNTYRIPGLITTDKNTLIAVYDIRYDNDADLPANIDVGMSRSTDGGKTWSPMKIIMDMGLPNETNGVGDPSILYDPVTKKLWVAALWSKGNRSIRGSGPGLSPDETGQFVLVSSADDGITWSSPYSITAQVKDPTWTIFFQGPGNGIALQDGKIVFPAQYWDATRMPYSTIIYSDDHGQTWKRGSGAKSNTTESAVVETTPGKLMLNMRDNRGSYRSVATSADMGNTWAEHPTSYSALPDPVCMSSLIKANVNIKGGQQNVLFFCNPNKSSAPRANITIKASLDLGETWEQANQLLIDERDCYGYSSLTKIDDNTLGLLYEGTKEIYFVKVLVSEIIK